MSSVEVKENLEVCVGQKNVSSENSCDIFTWERPTGRPSILRQSQADNISRTAHKGAKVCFQTPLRDPVTKRIMSPNRTSGTDSTRAVETFTSLPDQSSVVKNISAIPVNMQSNSISYHDDDMPVQSRGAHTLDLHNLHDFNPFQGSNKMANSPAKASDFPATRTSELTVSDTFTVPVCAPKDDQIVLEETHTPLDETLPFVPSVENSLADHSADTFSAEGTVILMTNNNERSMTVMEDQAQDLPLPPAGSYNFDFDNLESLNPFQTGGSKISNSPVVGKTPGVFDPRLPSQEAPQEPEISVQTPPTVPDVPGPSDEMSATTEASSSSTSPKENTMLLEFNFNDGAEVKCKPPPKQLGVKRPAGAKHVAKKTDAVITEKKNPAPKQLSSENSKETEPLDVPSAKGSYTFDFDKFDDPNFNPFGTKAKMGNSPARGVQTGPVLMQAALPVEQPEHRSLQAVPQSDDKVEDSELSVTVQLREAVETSAASHTNTPQSPSIQEPEAKTSSESRLDHQNLTIKLGVTTPSEDEFVPGAFFMPGGDFDGQIDYLEQFGSSTFKESALRKQSLYLKFDPLLKDSPKKTIMESSEFCLPRPSLAIRMMEAAKSERKQKSQFNSMKLLEDLPPPAMDTVVPDPAVLDLLVPTLKQPVKTEDSIIEVLRYSQRDMDAALQRADRQAEEQQQQLNVQIEALHLENQHMLFVVSEFESTITQITDEHKKKEDLAKIELERVLQEKDQLSKDLNDLERSFSSVVKRLDKCKEVIEGFKKNEETLKQYAQNCMERLQKEEKRYQALKGHAEEKLDQANKAIADVRTKMGTEAATLQVQLKREQLKVQSLQKDLEQKVKEVNDVTELCDELLLKVQKQGF